MLPRRIELSALKATSTRDKLQLTVRNFAVFHIPDASVTITDAALLTSMCSGEVWVSRAPHCRLIVVIYVDGNFAEEIHWHMLQQMAGERLQNAPFWKQLLLTVETNVELACANLGTKPRITVNINQDSRKTEEITKDTMIRYKHPDIRPPESILCVMLEGLRLECNFVETDWTQKRWVVSPVFPSYDTLQNQSPLTHSFSIISQHPSNPTTNGMLPLRLPDLISKDPKSLSCLLPASSSSPTLSANPLPNLKQSGQRTPKAELAQSRHRVIRQWLEDNQQNPYPSSSQKDILEKETGLARNSLMRLLSRYRKLYPVKFNTAIKFQPRDAPPGDERFMPSGSQIMQEDGKMLMENSLQIKSDSQSDEMLLDLVDSPSLWSDLGISPGTPSTPTALRAPWVKPDKPEPALLNITPSISVTTACTLIETAVKVSLCGAQRARPPGVQVHSSIPAINLSQIVPSLLNPGFETLMASNAEFIPKIVPVILSWQRHAQGAGLKAKMQALAAVDDNTNPMSLASMASHDISEILESVAQRRLWSMMHRKFYDPKIGNNLQSTRIESLDTRVEYKEGTQLPTPASSQQYDCNAGTGIKRKREDGCAYDHLFNEDCSDEGPIELSQGDTIDEENGIEFYESEDDFEDLLTFEDEEDDVDIIAHLDSLAEQERMEIERETDEMLFGDHNEDEPGNNGHDVDEMLLEEWSSVSSGTLEEADHQDQITVGPQDSSINEYVASTMLRTTVVEPYSMETPAAVT